MIATLRQVTFNYRFVYEAAYMDASRICSNRPREEGLSVFRAPDIIGPTYSYWLNTTTEPDENRAALMLGRGNFRVATSRGHLTDMVDLSPGSSLLVVLDHGSRAIPVLGTAQTWPPTGTLAAKKHRRVASDPESLISHAHRQPGISVGDDTPRTGAHPSHLVVGGSRLLVLGAVWVCSFCWCASAVTGATARSDRRGECKCSINRSST